MAAKEKQSPGFKPELARRVADLPGVPRRSSSGGSEESKKLIVGRDISLNGDITACDTLVVEGTVQATLSESRMMQIAESGVFTGKAEIDVAEIRGRFDGDMTTRERLVIHSTGRVTGQIRYGEIHIEKGGKIAGTIEVLTPERAVEPRLPERRPIEPEKPVEAEKTETAKKAEKEQPAEVEA